MDRSQIVKKISEALRETAPDALSVLYGSEARGDAKPDSDFDILVVLPDESGKGSFAQRKMNIFDRLYALELEHGVTISPLVVLKSIWQKLKTPFTVNVANDGIIL